MVNRNCASCYMKKKKLGSSPSILFMFFHLKFFKISKYQKYVETYMYAIYRNPCLILDPNHREYIAADYQQHQAVNYNRAYS